MAPAQTATQQRAREAKRVLLLHDTTDITCPAAECDEVGYLATGNAGFYLHHALCVSDDDSKCPLGIVWSQAWGRDQRSRARAKLGSRPAQMIGYPRPPAPSADPPNPPNPKCALYPTATGPCTTSPNTTRNPPALPVPRIPRPVGRCT